MIFPKLLPKRFLGIDIGTSVIKIVELSRWGERIKLENYGEILALALYQKPFRTFEKSTLLLSSQDVAKGIKAVISEAQIKTGKSIFSIPDFSSFFTNFELPPMTKAEINQAIAFEARRHIPLPLGEVTIDWEIIKGEVDQKKTPLKILLVAVPNELINQYRQISQASQLELVALEAEVFGLLRSLIPEDEKGIISLVDIGAQSTTCSIIEKRVLIKSHSFDLGGNQLTEQIAKSLSIDYKTAENLKTKYGLESGLGLGLGTPEKNIGQIILPLIDLGLGEIEKISKSFYQTEGKEIQKFIIAGGTSLLPGLKEYFEDYFKKEVEIANPFSKIFYPPILEETLKEMGPSYAIAVGMALRGLE